MAIQFNKSYEEATKLVDQIIECCEFSEQFKKDAMAERMNWLESMSDDIVKVDEQE